MASEHGATANHAVGTPAMTPSQSPSVLDGVRIAVVQVQSQAGDVPFNLALAERHLAAAAGRRADLTVFPECFLQGYALRTGLAALAERCDGPNVSRLAQLAREYRVALVAGFIEYNKSAPSRPHNSAIVVDSGGAVAGVYRKTHLFGDEGKYFSSGSTYPVFQIALRQPAPAIPVGVAICADIEYPEVIRLLALNGAQLVVVPSADMEPYRAQQAANIRSRAIENNVYLALANTVGTRDGFVFFGGSAIASPTGRVVSAGYGRERLVVTRLRRSDVDASGGVGAYLGQRRVETYGDLLRPRPRADQD